MKSFYLSFFLLISFTVFSQKDTLQYKIIINKAIAGKAWLVETKPNHFENFIEYNDRGRGPKANVKYEVDDLGIIQNYEAKGLAYMKTEVSENYKISNGNIIFESDGIKKESKLTEQKQFVSAKENFDNALLRALLKSPTKTLKVYPAGEAKAKLAKELNLKNGKKAFLYQTSGLGFSPSYDWVDENNFLIGSFEGDWFTAVRAEYEPFIKEFYDTEKEIRNNYFFELTPKLSTKPKNGIVIKNVNVLDIEKGVLQKSQTVIIRGHKIENIGKNLETPTDFDIIDGTNKTLMPGLWDMHTHGGDATSGILNMACGVTSIRNMGDDFEILDDKKNFDEHKLVGPKIEILSGFIDGKGPFTAPIGFAITNVEEGIEAIKKYNELGYQQIKLYSSIKPEWVKPLAAEAHKYKMKVAGHIPAYMSATQAIEAGYDEITHSNMLMLNFFGDTVDTRSMRRFTLVAQKGGDLDFESKKAKDFIALLKSKNIAVDPTVTIFEKQFLNDEANPTPYLAKVLDRLPASMQTIKGGGLAIPMGMKAIYEKSYSKMLEFAKKLHETGILLVAGTDNMAGFTLQRELELYAKAGIPNNEVLKMATYNSALISNKLNEKGTVSIGKTADLILIDGNPLENISDIRKVETTIREGQIHHCKKLFEAISVKYFK